MNKSLNELVVMASSGESLREIISSMSSSSTQFFGFCCIIDEETKLLGVITSGDIFRLITQDTSLDTKVEEVMTCNPTVVQGRQNIDVLIKHVSKSLSEKFGEQKQYTRFVPVVNEAGKLEDVLDMQEVVGASPLRKPLLAIYGMGFVGVTLAAAFASRGISVIGVDTNKKIIEQLEQGIPHVFEPRLEELLKRSINIGNISFASDAEKIIADFHIIAVGTPVDDGQVNFSSLEEVAKTISRNLKVGDTVVIRSTVPVSTSRQKILPILEKSGLKVGESINLAFCPERTVEGNAIKELFELPQIVGGATDECTAKSSSLFRNLTPSIVEVETLEAAELVKLVNNSFRDLSFAFSNALTLVADQFNLDTHKLILASNDGYPRDRIPKPSPGVGGYCLTKDPFIYAHFGTSLGHAKLANIGRKINSSVIDLIFSYIMDFIIFSKTSAAQVKVTILGMAFKGLPETNDLRGSTSVELYNLLLEKNFSVSCFDCVIGSNELEKEGFNTESMTDSLRNSNIFLLMNNNPKNIPNDFLNRIPPEQVVLFFDGWGLMGKKEVESNLNWTYATLGYMTRRSKIS